MKCRQKMNSIKHKREYTTTVFENNNNVNSNKCGNITKIHLFSVHTFQNRGIT